MEQKKIKKKQTEQKNMEKEVSVRKPYILYFLIVCSILAVLILIVSVICYGIVNIQGEKDKVYIENIDDLEPMDVAIVPGASVLANAPEAKAKDRLDGAIKLYEVGLVERIIVSGDVSEVDTMTAYLVLKGIPSENLACDDYATDTYESLARIKEMYQGGTYYFCTQKMYVNRAKYLMNRVGIEGRTICVDTMQYIHPTKSWWREYFATTKAVFEGFFRDGTPHNSVREKAFAEVPEVEENHDHTKADEIPVPVDSVTTDSNPNDDYDVTKAVEYARKYAFDRNREYPEFEENCTNFVSQCLVVGGIEMQGTGEVSKSNRWKSVNSKKQWYSVSEYIGEHGHRHHNTTLNFVNTNEFIRYFTEERGYEMSIFDNNYDGKMDYYQRVSCGDVYILYNTEGEVDHIGLITGIGDMNVYYCANTSDKREYSAFNISDVLYPQIGILHMSGKK